MGRYDGKRVAVTGAGSGIGAAIALGMAAEGAAVAVIDMDGDRAGAIAAKCGNGSAALTCDVADAQAVVSTFAEIDDVLGPVHVVVNNAGHAPVRNEALTQRVLDNMQRAMTGDSQQPLESLSSVSLDDWDRMIRVHLYGTFYCAREAMTRMERRATGGVILNMASILGIVGSAAAAHYAAAKGGIIAFTKSLAAEGAAADIRVNAIAPGWIDTPMTQGTLAPEVAGVLRMQIPMHRFGTADEIAAMALHLCSDEAGYTTGQVISVNGGLF
jgi:NAD(P)-dependent dehydrogenase (short-subunit alcohol dehydrogenase family)